MAYADPLDAAAPASDGPVGSGDDEIRMLKRAIRQRLETFFVSLDTDPLGLIAGIIKDQDIPLNEVDGTKIKVGTLPYDRLTNLPGVGAPDDSVSTAALQAKAVTNDKIADGAVDTRTLAADAVDSTKLADNSVGSAHIQDGSIHKSELSAGLQGVLAIVKYGYITLPLATTIADGGVFRGGESIAATLDTNDLSGYLTPVVIQPIHGATEVSGATYWSDGFIMHASIAMVGGQETIVYRLTNLSGLPITISGMIILWAIMQQLGTGPGGAL